MEDTVSYIPKIFGIGLPKTGNYSLTYFLRHCSLRLKGLRYPNPTQWRNIQYYNFLVDTPCNIYFRELYFMYPNAKFVLTHRNDDDWKESWYNHRKNIILTERWQRYLHSKLEGITPSVHLEMVDDFLDDYFLLDLDDIDVVGLCDYLDLPLQQDYPHKNARI